MLIFTRLILIIVLFRVMPVCKILVRWFWFVLLLVNFSEAFAQTETAGLLKSLKIAQTKANYQADPGNVRLLTQISFQYLYYNADSSLFYAREALKLSQLQHYLLGEALAWQNIGRANYVIGRYDVSLDAATKLMAISNKLHYTGGTAGAYQIMGLIYLEQNRQTDAVANLDKALVLFDQMGDTDQMGKTYFDLAIAYDDMGKTARAFYFVKKAMASAAGAKDDNLLTMAQNRAGEIYFHQKAYKKALTYYEKVAGAKSTSNWERDFAFSGMAQCYYGLGKYKMAISAANKGYRLSRQVNSGSDAARALQILADSYAAVKDYHNAYTCQVAFKKLNDSIYNSEKEREINSLHLKQQQADNKRLEQEIKSKEAELDFRSRLLFFRNLIALATVIFIVYIIFSNRQKTLLNKVLKKQNEDISLQKEELSKQKEILDGLNNTKNQLFSIIGHDLRSPFAAMMQSIEIIRAGEFSPEEQGVLMEDFYRQVNQVSIMVNNLLAWAASQQEGIKCRPVQVDATKLAGEVLLLNSFIAKNKDIFLDHKFDGEKLVFADADHVRIIIQNLLGNAIKFTRRGGVIQITYSQDLNFTAIHIKDSGVGIKPDKLDKLFKVSGKEISAYGTDNEAGAGLGLSLIKQFTDANSGRLEVKSKTGEGSEFIVYLPRP